MPFKEGDKNINRQGRPKGAISLTAILKEKLKEMPPAKTPKERKTNAEILVTQMMGKAKEGDLQTQKLFWSYVDGMPRETKDIKVELPTPLLNVLDNDSNQTNCGTEEEA